METKHTPGPWFARKGDTFNPDRTWGVVVPLDRETCAAVDGDLTGFDANANGRTVVLAEVFDTESDQGEADARLIAAAPDMLAALESIANSGLAKDSADARFLCGIARAAIAKAGQ